MILELEYTNTFTATWYVVPDAISTTEKQYFSQTFWKDQHSFQNLYEETLSFLPLNVSQFWQPMFIM